MKFRMSHRQMRDLVAGRPFSGDTALLSQHASKIRSVLLVPTATN